MVESSTVIDKRSYYKHREKRCAKSRKWNAEHKNQRAANQRRYYMNHAEAQRAWTKRKILENRRLVLNHYGAFCHCPGCLITEEKFLSLDHIEGGGNKHRREVGGSGAPMYRWIIKNNFPPIFQVLCHNCNCAKGFYGKCPHLDA
jgi:hypothetical protein